VAVEADSLSLEELALDVRPEAVAVAATARGVDDALPRHQVEERCAEHAERRSHWPRRARLPEYGRDLAVGHDLAARDSAHEPIDEAVEGRRAGLHRHHGACDSRRPFAQ
jgi:hypothetical protein